jgi:Tfp pilus assembly protein PilN
MIEINLIPDVKLELIRAERARTGVISIALLAGIISLGLVALLAIYVYVIQGGLGLLAKNSFESEYKKLESVEDLTKVLTIKNQLEKVNELNKNKHADSRVYDLLNAIIPPAPNEVKVVKLTQDNAAGIIMINGQTRAYESVEAFKKTLDGAQVKFNNPDTSTEESVKLANEISVDSVSYGEDSDGQKIVSFTLSFAFAEELFSAKIPAVVISLDNTGNVTDSYLGIPRNLFIDTGGAQ